MCNICKIYKYIYKMYTIYIFVKYIYEEKSIRKNNGLQYSDNSFNLISEREQSV